MRNSHCSSQERNRLFGFTKSQARTGEFKQTARCSSEAKCTNSDVSELPLRVVSGRTAAKRHARTPPAREGRVPAAGLNRSRGRETSFWAPKGR
jgi:hypothetical protein